MSNKKLTKNQKMFCDEYLIDLNGTRAYKAAYKNVTRDETAAASSSRLLRNVKVKKYLDKKMKEREKRTEITQDKVLKELAKIGFADIKDYLNYRTAKAVVEYDEDGEPIIDYQQIIDVIDSDKVDTSIIQEVSIGKDGTFKFKLYDKQKALVDIGKHLGMFRDKEYRKALTDKVKAQTKAIDGIASDIEDREALKKLVDWNDIHD